MEEEELELEKDVLTRFNDSSEISRIVRHRYLCEILDCYVHYYRLERICESPIEKSFLINLMEVSYIYGLPIGIYPNLNDLFLESGQIDSKDLYIFPQYEISLSDRKIRVDFLLVVRNRRDHKRLHKLIVECDGHDFHEKTKQQAAKDKSRDRLLIAAGYLVFRYTGSELYKSSANCAEEAIAHLSRIIHV